MEKVIPKIFIYVYIVGQLSVFAMGIYHVDLQRFIQSKGVVHTKSNSISRPIALARGWFLLNNYSSWT